MNIKQDKEQGKTFKQKLEDLKKMSSGNSFLCGDNIVRKDHLQIKQEADNKGIEVKLEVIWKKQQDFFQEKKRLTKRCYQRSRTI